VHARADAGGGDDCDVRLRHVEAVWRGAAARPSSLYRPKIILPAVV
jgi:hypothetical protein